MGDVNPKVAVSPCILIACLFLVPVLSVHYEPNWESIDSRPLPDWYDDVKIGIFLHWGVFSVPSYRSEWFWEYWQGTKNADIVKFMKDNYKPDFTYSDFAAEFTTEFFNPEEWADVFNASGARYIVLTSKHHEGFTNWPSKYSWNWNSMDVGPNRDLVGSLADAIRSKYSDIHFGLYHSMYEWFNPLYLEDKANNFTTRDFADKKTLPELYEIVNRYKPDVIWSDGDAEAPDVYWNSTGFLAWLYNDSPVKDTVVANDRWGANISCHHGGYYTCKDRYNPGVLMKHKWENAMTIDKSSWGYRRNATLADLLTMDELIKTLVETVRKGNQFRFENYGQISGDPDETAHLDLHWLQLLSLKRTVVLIGLTVLSCGGNILINVGPTKDGRIIPIFEERLRSLGDWLRVNGEAIYGSKPWIHQNDSVTPDVWYTSKMAKSGAVTVYAIVLNWPDTGEYYLAAPFPGGQTSISLLGYPDPIGWKMPTAQKGIYLEIPAIPFNKQPCDYAWVFKMENLVNQQQHVSIKIN